MAYGSRLRVGFIKGAICCYLCHLIVLQHGSHHSNQIILFLFNYMKPYVYLPKKACHFKCKIVFSKYQTYCSLYFALSAFHTLEKLKWYFIQYIRKEEFQLQKIIKEIKIQADKVPLHALLAFQTTHKLQKFPLECSTILALKQLTVDHVNCRNCRPISHTTRS